MYSTRSPTRLHNPFYKTLLSIIAGLQTLLNGIVWVEIPGVILFSKNKLSNTLQNWIHSLFKDFQVCQNIICNGAPKCFRNFWHASMDIRILDCKAITI